MEPPSIPARFKSFNGPAMLAAQDTVAKHYARSVDFARLVPTHEALINTDALTEAAVAQTEWAESLAKTIDFSALYDALAASATLTDAYGEVKGFTESLKQQAEVFARIAEGFRFDLPTLDLAKWIGRLDRWIPVNLQGVQEGLATAARISLDEGLPLSWIPRAEIVVALISASSREERHVILRNRTIDILDDCEAALVANDTEWARECRNAIGALRAGFHSPAQSHAGNIVDSIVSALHGKQGRDHAKQRAAEDFDDVPLQLAAESLTLRPLFRALTAWWPASGEAPPEHFARHTTAHAVGYVGVFAPLSALVAVMLATSLTVQYSSEHPESTFQ
ncbi:MAG: hypothetical protein DLM66_04850 [Candidatus Dormiibacter spiritus]|nr:MAG: hypothetical protein DLM66_04850 [Candidatus Dormibacteraeota bacterium]